MENSSSFSFHFIYLPQTFAAGNDDNLFEIDQITGEIIVKGTLDRESRGNHTIIVKATNDRNYIAQGPFDVMRDTSLKVINIPVGDVNDNPPFFLKPLIVTGKYCLFLFSLVNYGLFTLSTNPWDTK